MGFHPPSRRPVRRAVVAVLGVALVSVVGIAIVRREEFLLRWRLRRLTSVESRYLEREAEGQRDGLPDALAAAETWILSRARSSSVDLASLVVPGRRRRNLVLLNLLWKQADGQADPDLEPFWRGLAPGAGAEEFFRDAGGRALVFSVAEGLHEIVESGVLFVRREGQRTLVTHARAELPSGSAGEVARRIARSRLDSPPTPVLGALRCWVLEGAPRSEHDRLLARGARLPRLPELETEVSRRLEATHCLRIATPRGVGASHSPLNWPWHERALARLEALARGPLTPPSECSPGAALELLEAAAGWGRDPRALPPVVLAMAGGDWSGPAAGRRKELLRKLAAHAGGASESAPWLAAALHVLGDSGALVECLARAEPRWPPLDDLRLGCLLSARPESALPEFLLACLERDPGDPVPLELAGLLLDAFSSGERARLEARLRDVAPAGIGWFLESAGQNPQGALSDPVLGVLANVGPAPRASYLAAVARWHEVESAGVGEVDWEALFRELEPLAGGARWERFRARVLRRE